jgi:ADP-ribosylglycohydrolase
MNQNISVNKFRGMVWGAILGDVLGSAYEHTRKKPPLELPNPLIAKSWLYRSMHSNFTTITPAGHATDDTEMTIATLRAILNQNFAKEYLDWGKTHCSFAGKNTRKYLFNIATLRGLNARIDRFYDENAHAESNGFLMRASPLVLLADEDMYYESARLTGNYNEACCKRLREYVNILKVLVAPGGSINNVISPITSIRLEQVGSRDIKGYSECAMFCCRDYIEWSRNTHHTFLETMQRVISFGGDTDTNACIVGAIAGANIGMHEMFRDTNVRANMDLILQCHAIRRKYDAYMNIEDMQPAYPQRPEDYHPRCVDTLINIAAERWHMQD